MGVLRRRLEFKERKRGYWARINNIRVDPKARWGQS